MPVEKYDSLLPKTPSENSEADVFNEYADNHDLLAESTKLVSKSQKPKLPGSIVRHLGRTEQKIESSSSEWLLSQQQSKEMQSFCVQKDESKDTTPKIPYSSNNILTKKVLFPYSRKKVKPERTVYNKSRGMVRPTNTGHQASIENLSRSPQSRHKKKPFKSSNQLAPLERHCVLCLNAHNDHRISEQKLLRHTFDTISRNMTNHSVYATRQTAINITPSLNMNQNNNREVYNKYICMMNNNQLPINNDSSASKESFLDFRVKADKHLTK